MLIVLIFAFLPVFGLGLIISLELLKELFWPTGKATLLAHSQLHSQLHMKRDTARVGSLSGRTTVQR